MAKAALKGSYLECIQFHLISGKALAAESLKAEWSDYTKFYEATTDIMFAGRLSLDPETELNEKRGLGYRLSTTTTKLFTIEISLGEFTTDYSRLITAAYLFPEGLEKTTDPVKLSILPNELGCNEWVLRRNEEQVKITGSYRIPAIFDLLEEKYKDATVIFFFRTFHGTVQVWPVDRKGTERYMSIKIDLVKKDINVYSRGDGGNMPTFSSLFMFGNNIRTGTKQELISAGYWIKKQKD